MLKQARSSHFLSSILSSNVPRSNSVLGCVPRLSALQRYGVEVQRWMNQPPVRRRLRKQLARYNQLCASLETLRQTESAIEAFARFEGEVGTGGHFLALYGVLQALVLQQDAVCHLQEALGDASKSVITNRQLQSVRSIRNWSVGHPTKVDRRDSLSHHKIRRARLGKGFELVSAFDDGRQQYAYVSIADLVRTQKLALGRLLRKMILVLREIDLRKQVEIERRSDYRQGRTSAPTSHVKNAEPPKRATVPSRLHKQTHKVLQPDRRGNERRRVERATSSDRRRSAGRIPPPVQHLRGSPAIRHFTPRAAITGSNLRRLA